MVKLKVCFIGLGVMGYPMAGHLARAGHDVCVYNRTVAKAESWVAEYGGRHAPTPGAAAQGADIVLSCVGADDDLRAVTVGDEGAFAAMKVGAIYVDHTTSSAEVARELAAEATSHGIHFLDAPVSGGQVGAEKGRLTIMVGGEPAAFEGVKDVLAVYGHAVNLMGPAGSGQLTKMVNQITACGIVQSLAESLNFAMRAGLDPNRVVEVISKGAAQSWQLDNRSSTMIDDSFDFGFAVDWMVKDLGLCLHEAETNGSKLPTVELVRGFYNQIQERGGGRWDFTSLIRLLRD